MSQTFFFQAEDGIRDYKVTGVQTCALPISGAWAAERTLDSGWASAEPRSCTASAARDKGCGVAGGLAGLAFRSSACGALSFFASGDRKSTRLNSSHLVISYAVFCLKKKKTRQSYRSR